MLVLINLYIGLTLFAGSPNSWEIVRHMHSQIRDAEFIYEVDTVIPDPKNLNNGKKYSLRYLSGIGKAHFDGICYFEYQLSSKTGDTVHKFSIERDGEIREIHGVKKKRSIPSQFVGSSGSGLFGQPNSFGYIWPVGMLAGASRSVLETAEDLGETRINGRLCRTFKIVTSSHVEVQYSFDLQRNGHVVDLKMIHNGNLRHKIDSYEFTEILGQNGKKYWFPVECAWHVFARIPQDNMKVIPVRTPIYPPTKYRILPATIKLNTGVARDALRVRLDSKGLLLTDQMAKTSPKLMQELYNARKPIAPEEVQQAIVDAKKQEKELRAARLVPSRDWLSWLPLFSAILGCLGLLGVFWGWRYSN